MSRPKPFCPVNPKTALLDKHAVVTDSKEFLAFLDWLTLDSQKELRGRAYTLIDGKAPTTVAKAMLIDAVAGSYISQLLLKTNRATAVALSIDAGLDEKNQAAILAGQMSAELKGLKDAIQIEIFEGQLRKSSMTDEAINRLVSAFDGQNLLAKDVATALAQTLAEEKKATQIQLTNSVRQFLERKDRRADVKRVGTSHDVEYDVAKLGFFAPLVRYIETVQQPKARAEMLAHLEDYVRSGWFHADMVEKSTHPGCGLGGWYGATHHTVDALRETFFKLESGQKVADHEIGLLFEKRVAELTIGIKTAKSKKKSAIYGADTPWVVSDVFKRDKINLFSSIAGSAEIDSFWISPDNNQYFLTCATSSSTLSMQSDQMARYLEAIKISIENGRLGHLTIPNPPIGIDCRTLALCAGQASQGKKGQGRQAGYDMTLCFDKGSPTQEIKTMAHLNSLPGIALLAKEARFSPEDYAYYRFDLIGERETVWNKQIAKAKEMNTFSAHEQGIAALTGFLGSFGESLQNHPLKPFLLKASGIGDKPYHLFSGLLFIVEKVNSEFSLMGNEQKSALSMHLGKGGRALLDNLSRIVPHDQRDKRFHKEAIAEFKTIVEMADASFLSQQAKSTKRRSKNVKATKTN